MTQDPDHPVLRLGDVAHGGHVVARTDDGRVVFVRHGLPGELVRVRLTDADPAASFWRADVTEVLEPAPGRRDAHVWPAADAARAASEGRSPLGGAEFGHADLPTQRELKRRVLTEQLSHLAGHDWDGTVREAPGESADGTGWRTRLHLDVAPDGTPGMHPHRSEDLAPLTDMPLATDAIRRLAPWSLRLEGAERVDVAAPANGQQPLLHVSLRADAGEARTHALRERLGAWGAQNGVSVTARSADHRRIGTWAGTDEVRETLAVPEVAGLAPGALEWRVSPTGFWQIHRAAPGTLARAVLEAAQLRPGETVWDLYSGAGLFTAVAALAVGETGAVFAVEGSPVTSADAAHNLADVPHVTSVRGDVARVLTGRGGGRRGGSRGAGSRAASSGATSRRNEAWAPRPPRPDVVVMDPPRAGAAKEVLAAVDQAGPRAIVYIACDPAALGRDLGRLRRRGWRIDRVEAFDLYPNTHHVEAVALLGRDS
ncbi:class I SAM-dependent RNA methyltransferase [Kocuria tytonicola]|uniref:Class I SAM-dependent RNA methyltransferase n=1 Tax=Kocuria tytonicola TaxID=2055946 RepID=A0A3L9LFX0_9MICC|nr:TRAM domain-containing protein [Kocuria tytonicola]RLY95062.1 class I SAM-dependent RNA methyltransferase [Kocuria tytonicola]